MPQEGDYIPGKGTLMPGGDYSNPPASQGNAEYIQKSLGVGAQLATPSGAPQLPETPPVPGSTDAYGNPIAPKGSAMGAYIGGVWTPTPQTPTPGTQVGQVGAAATYAGAGFQPARTEQQIREELLRNSQANIDAINKQFQATLAQDVAVGQAQQTDVSASAARMGLMGSPTGGAMLGRQAEATGRVLSQDEAVRSAAIAAIYDKVNTNAYLYAQQERTQALQDSGTIAENQRKIAQTALDSAAGFAAAGVTGSKLQTNDQQTWQHIKDATGYSDFALNAYLNSKLPQNLQPHQATSYIPNADGTTTMKVLTLDPQTGQSTEQDFNINIPYSQMNPQGVIKDNQGGLLMPDPKDPNKYIRINPLTPAETAKLGQAEYYRVQAGLSPTGAATSSGQTHIDAAPTTSGSILNQTGLSIAAFNFLTQGTASMSRMASAQRNKIMGEAQDFLNKNGVDIATFQSQYKAYNDVLASNIQRQAKTQIMEKELLGTGKNLMSVVNSAELGKVNLQNVAKVWGGQQVNDPLATQYALHFQQLKNELAGYYAASQGKTSPDVIDNQDAAESITNGMASGSLSGFLTAIENSTSKMKDVLQSSVDTARQSVWDLFGVGDKYTPAKTDQTQTPQVGGKINDPTALPDGTIVTGDDGQEYMIQDGKPIPQ